MSKTHRYTITTQSLVTVIGAGAMGTGIAQVAATAGHQVILYDNAENTAEKSLAQLQQRLNARVAKAKMTQAEADIICQRIQSSNDIKDAINSDLVIEAIIENLDIKQHVFATLEKICSEHTIFASNTSSLSISALASKLEHPQRVVGMHFFNPAPVLKLVEVVSGLQTLTDVADSIYNLADQWGKRPVHVKSSPGFIVNRVARPFYAEAFRSINEGVASIPTIDTIMRDAGGFKLGPFELTDLIGQDVNFAVTKSVYDAYYQDPRFLPSIIQEDMVAAGLLGRKTRQGFYTYPIDHEITVNQAHMEPPRSAPKNVSIHGQLYIADAITDMARAASMNVSEYPSENYYLTLGHVRMQLTDGRLASQCANDLGITDFILFDLALDYNQADCIVLTPAGQASAKALSSAIGFWQALGKNVHVIKDVPGMQLMRTVCMLANEAADTVNQGICTIDDVDTAMRAGVAYPIGPLKWAENIGIKNVVSTLTNIATLYGEDRYRCSPLLQAAKYSGLSIHSLISHDKYPKEC